MLILKGFSKQPWWIELETDDTLISLYHTQRPYIDTERGKDLFVEQLAEQAMRQGLAVKAIHCWPLAWGELTA